MLAGALVAAGVGYDEGAFVFLAPEGNVACRRAVERYRKHLTSETTFASWTLEDLVRPFEWSKEPAWMADLVDRYLAFARVEACIEREEDRTACPACGHVGSLPLWSGEPTRVVERMARRREVALGGCVVLDDKPTRRCAECGDEWLGAVPVGG